MVFMSLHTTHCAWHETCHDKEWRKWNPHLTPFFIHSPFGKHKKQSNDGNTLNRTLHRKHLKRERTFKERFKEKGKKWLKVKNGYQFSILLHVQHSSSFNTICFHSFFLHSLDLRFWFSSYLMTHTQSTLILILLIVIVMSLCHSHVSMS